MDADAVFAEVQRLSQDGLVEITGGEPMLQERELVPFVQRLLDGGYQVLIETSGERPLANVPKQVHKIVDVKCPDSGEADTFRIENLMALTKGDEVKFVIASQRDYDFARDFTRKHELEEKSEFGDFFARVSERRDWCARCIALPDFSDPRLPT